VSAVPEELAGVSEAEGFFEALGVPYEQRVLDAHRLHVMKVYGLAVESWLGANPGADAAARRRAMARALREAHDAFADERPAPCNPFAPGLVTLRRR
jgi:nitrogenase-stabilizing/protective protein